MQHKMGIGAIALLALLALWRIYDASYRDHPAHGQAVLRIRNNQDGSFSWTVLLTSADFAAIKRAITLNNVDKEHALMIVVAHVFGVADIETAHCHFVGEPVSRFRETAINGYCKEKLIVVDGKSVDL